MDPAGTGWLNGNGYEPTAHLHATPAIVERMRKAATGAVRCVNGRAIRNGLEWVAEGDPMEAAIHAWAMRMGANAELEPLVQQRLAYTSDRMLSSVVVNGRSVVLGAPEAVMRRCLTPDVTDAVKDLARRGRRVLAVAEGRWRPGAPPDDADANSACSP